MRYSMIDIDNRPERQARHLIFVIDTSIGMSGTPMREVNEVMSRVIWALLLDNNLMPDPDVVISVLTYNQAHDYDTATSVHYYSWTDKCVEGDAHLFNALEGLDALLISLGENGNFTPVTPPAIFFIHGCKQTGLEWYNELERLSQNEWFGKAIKRAVAYNFDDLDVLSDIVGSHELVLEAHNIFELGYCLFKCVSLVLPNTLYLEREMLITIREDLENESSGGGLLAESPLLGVIAPERDNIPLIQPSKVSGEYGRAKCKLLKTIRKAVADANGIPYEITECDSVGHCNGACPICDQEAAELSHKLSQIVRSGKQIQMPGMDTSLLDGYLPITSDIYDIYDYPDFDNDVCGWMELVEPNVL